MSSVSDYKMVTTTDALGQKKTQLAINPRKAEYHLTGPNPNAMPDPWKAYVESDSSRDSGEGSTPRATSNQRHRARADPALSEDGDDLRTKALSNRRLTTDEAIELAADPVVGGVVLGPLGRQVDEEEKRDIQRMIELSNASHGRHDGLLKEWSERHRVPLLPSVELSNQDDEDDLDPELEAEIALMLEQDAVASVSQMIQMANEAAEGRWVVETSDARLLRPSDQQAQEAPARAEGRLGRDAGASRNPRPSRRKVSLARRF